VLLREGSRPLTEPNRASVLSVYRWWTFARSGPFARWWPFVLLLVAGASRWVVVAVHPEADSTLASEAVGCTWAALVSLAFFPRQPSRIAPQAARPGSHPLRNLLAGAMLFGGPAIALLIHVPQFDVTGLTISLALTPVVIAIAASAFGTESSEGIAGRIWPGLAAVAGLLLILAQPTLGDARSDLALCLAPILTGVGAALFCADLPDSTSRVTLALTGAAALFALALAGAYVFSGVRPSLPLLAVAGDGLLALLGMATLAQLGATRWSSQFTWVPLLIVLEGIALIRPKLTAYWVVGLVLLFLASVYLLLPQTEDPDPNPSIVPG